MGKADAQGAVGVRRHGAAGVGDHGALPAGAQARDGAFHAVVPLFELLELAVQGEGEVEEGVAAGPELRLGLLEHGLALREAGHLGAGEEVVHLGADGFGAAHAA